MKKFKFLKERHTEDETIYAVLNSNLEKTNLADCYDNYGQKWGHYNAQDYSLHNSVSDAKKECVKSIREKFYINDEFEVSIDENSKGFFIRTDADLSEKKIAEINSYIEEYEKDNSNYEEVLAYHYHDGQSWKSIIVEGDNFDECCTHEAIEDEEFIKELEESLENESANYEIEVF